MKKEHIYICDRCGSEIDTEKEPYGELDYAYKVKNKEGYNCRMSLTGSYEDIHLCKKCADLFHTVLGLYGFETIRDRWWNESINLKK